MQQFRFVCEAVRQNLNLTAAAKALGRSQSGISKSISDLEIELGIEIFTRYGKRIQSVTEQGAFVIAAAARILEDLEGLNRIRSEFARKARSKPPGAATRQPER